MIINLYKKSPMYLFYKVELLYNRRYMLKRSTAIIGPDTDSYHVARSIFGLLQIITNSANNDPQLFLQKIIKYSTNDSIGTIQIKANLITGIIHNKIPLQTLSAAYNAVYPQSKLSLAVIGTAQSRVFAEIGIATTHILLNDPFIQWALLTCDTIKTNSKSNTYADLLLGLKHPSFDEGVQKYMDVKSGSAMIKTPIRGTIGQLAYFQKEQIKVPNDAINVHMFDLQRFTALKSRFIEILNAMPAREGILFKNFMQQYEQILNGSEDPLTKHVLLDTCCLNVQSLPSFSKALSFINLVFIKNELLSLEEQTFVKSYMSKSSANIFNNQRALEKSLQEALEIYNHDINREPIKNLKELAKSSGWKSLFISDIFLP